MSPRGGSKKKSEVIPNHTPAPSPAPQKRIHSGPLIGLASFAIVMVVVLVMIFQFVFSRASLTVTIAPETIGTTMDAMIGTEEMSSDEEKSEAGVLEGTVRSIEDQLTMTITGLNPKRINRQAQGIVTITNSLDGPVTLLAQTAIVSEGGITFRLNSGLVIPAGGSEVVGITSVGTGEAMNVSPTRWTFPDLPDRFRLNVIGLSTEHTTGGIENIAEVTASDIEQAKATVSEALVRRLHASLLPTEDHRLRVTTPVILDVKTPVVPGDAVSSFEMTVAARLIIVEPLRSTLTAAIIQQIGRSEAGKGLDPRLTIDPILDSVSWTIDQIDYPRSRAMIHGEVTSRLIPSHELLGVSPADLVGHGLEDISARLHDNPIVKDVEISLRPRLLSRMPLIPSRITVMTKIADEERLK